MSAVASPPPVTYDYDSAERGSPARRELVELIRYRDLLRQLVSRNIKVRYKRSILGVAWSVLSPLLTMVVLSLVFAALFRTTVPDYPLYLFPGLLAWSFFAQTTSIMAVDLIGGADFWKRIYVPRTAFGIASALTGLVHLGLALVPVAGLLVFYHRMPGWSLLTLPLAAANLAMFTIGVGFVVSALARYFPDVIDLYQVVLTAWLYFTPVIYPASIIGERYRRLFAVNPVSLLVDGIRAPLYDGVMSRSIGVATVVALATLATGWWVFTRSADELPYKV